MLDSDIGALHSGGGKVAYMTALSTRDKEYLKKVGREVAEKNPDAPGFNVEEDPMNTIEEADEVTQGPSLDNFNGEEPDDRYDITDSILREDSSVLISESMLSCDLGDDEDSRRKDESAMKKGMRTKTLISRLSDSTGDGNPECLASVDGLLMRIVSISVDSRERPILHLSER